MNETYSGSNSAARETALLEALWRGDELAAALRAARDELDSVRIRLAQAEETIAELVEIGDAAQAAIDELRARLSETEAKASLYLAQQEAVAAELFALATGRNPAPRNAPAWRRRAASVLRWPFARR